MRGQCTKSARARKRGDHAHTCSTLWLGVPRIFLIAPLSYDAVAFYLNRGEQRLRYEKLATSSFFKTHSPSQAVVGEPCFSWSGTCGSCAPLST